MKKGLSDIFSALLLIMIASSLGISIYLFFNYQFYLQVDNLSRSINYYETRLSTRFKVTLYRYDTSSKLLQFYIYNYGDTVIKIDSIYIDGVRHKITPLIEILTNKIVLFNYTITLSPGGHRIRLVTTDGVTHDIQINI